MYARLCVWVDVNVCMYVSIEECMYVCCGGRHGLIVSTFCCVPPYSPIVGLARHANVSLLPLHERKKKNEMKEKAGTTLSNTQEVNPTLVSGVLSGILCRCKCLPTQAKTPKAARLS